MNSRWVRGLMDVLFPRQCEVCDTRLLEGEEFMCLHCRMRLPLCNIHTDPFNTMHERLARHARIERAAAYFYYVRQSPYTKLIQAAKYNNRPRIARSLAADFASAIKDSGFFDGIDLLLPVPIHKSKLRKRGYNQSHHITLGINEVTGISIGSNLVATRPHSTQTKAGAEERYLNSLDIFKAIDSQDLEGKHILVIDDVMTTGATLRACCEEIRRAAPTATISVLTLALTQSD